MNGKAGNDTGARERRSGRGKKARKQKRPSAAPSRPGYASRRRGACSRNQQ